mmetsp:Transcript_10292/g.30981  ORF Transcript_10292/g.30981 Transcript_10292/m.30981 type:complete len:313 (+) Transcript_10292:2326-3264(+)
MLPRHARVLSLGCDGGTPVAILGDGHAPDALLHRVHSHGVRRRMLCHGGHRAAALLGHHVAVRLVLELPHPLPGQARRLPKVRPRRPARATGLQVVKLAAEVVDCRRVHVPARTPAAATGQEVRQHLRVVLQDLPVDQVPHLFGVELAALELKGQLRDGLGGGLPLGLRQSCEVGVCQRLLARRAVGRIERQHLLQQGHSAVIGTREILRKVYAWLAPHVHEEAACFLVADLVDDFFGGGTEQVGDELQLVHHVAAREQRLPQQHLREDAPDRPDVNRGAVLCEETAAQLRCPVPAGGHIVRPEDRGGHVIE